jgi:Domain of unknown function (DUF4407)
MSASSPRPLNLQRIVALLARLGGADPSTLGKVPRARDAFAQMGLVLLVTSSLAVLSMAFALTHGVHLPWLVGLPLAVLWGAVILTIDRFLLTTMSAAGSLKRAAGMAVPRLLMAVVLSATVSTPLVLEVFRDDIRAELYTYHLEQSTEQAKKESQSKEQLEVNRLRKEIAGHEAVLAGHLPVAQTDPAIDQAESDRRTKQNRLDGLRNKKNAAYEAWQCELGGAGSKCRNATNRRGAGPLAAAKRQEYLEAVRQLEAAGSGLAAAEDRADELQAAADAERATALGTAQAVSVAALPALRERLAVLIEAIRRRGDEGSSVNANDNGLLAQVRALDRVGARDPGLRVAHALVAALFFLIEILPVLAKLLLAAGPASAYETALRSDDEQIRDRAELDREEAREIEADRSKTRIAIERHMRAQEQRLGEQANDQVAEQMAEVITVAMQDWAEQLRLELAARTAAPSPAAGTVPSSPHGASVAPPAPMTVVDDALAGLAQPTSASRPPRARRSAPVAVHPLPDPAGDDAYVLPDADQL